MRVHNLDVRCKPVPFAQNETIFTRSTNLSPCTNRPVPHLERLMPLHTIALKGAAMTDFDPFADLSDDELDAMLEARSSW
ncbi:MAG: hypothetical protein ACLTSX_14215 [Collinsella sp.]